MKTPIGDVPSFLARAIQGVRYVLTGKRPDEFFGPNQPIEPQAQTQARGRQFDYPTGINLVYHPRAEGGGQISFPQLRALADTSDLVRLAIETRKDQLCRLPWQILPRDVDEQEPDDRCKKISDFLLEPDRDHDWATWLRMLLEDMLVIDAATIYPRLTRGGDLYSLDLMDGAMFKRIITADGRTPVPPEAAYQQIIKGLPAVDYSRDELLYMPRNPRTNRLYGYSPVEQIVVTVNIALRRQAHQLQYYTEGSTPDLMIGVPKDWQPEQIAAFQAYFDALLSGNTAERRRSRFVPGEMKPFDTKEAVLKDEYDEWLARVVCFCFSLPPTAFVKQMNRATADTAQNAALEEGLAPMMQWTKTALDRVIAKFFGCPDLEFAWQPDEEVDPLERAQVDEIYLTAKVITPDEVREDLGREPLTQAQKDELAPAPQMVGPDGKPMPPGKAPVSTGAKPPAAAKVDVVKKNARSRRSTAIARTSRRRAPLSGKY